MRARNITHHTIRTKLDKMHTILKPEVISQLGPKEHRSVLREIRRTSMDICRITRRLEKSLTTTPTKELP